MPPSPCRPPRHRSCPSPAFTYAELLMALTILAVLMTIAVPNFIEARTRAQVARSKAEQLALKLSIDAYRLDARAYPPNRKTGTPDGWDLVVLTTPVCYQAHLPLDCLTEPDSRGRRSANLSPIPYRYLNALQIDPDHGLTISEPSSPIGGGFVAAVLWGYGPNAMGNPSSQPISTWTPSGWTAPTLYDPSNGSFSGGEIYTRIP